MTPRVRLDLLLDAAALESLAAEARLLVMVPASHLPGIAGDIAAALVHYAAAHTPAAEQPTLKETVTRGREVASHARALLALLDADHCGPDECLAPHVPVPGWLIADPARFVPGIDTAIALDSGEARGDVARDTMLAEAGMHLDAPSAFGAHDVARVAVAALRQLAVLADTTASHAAVVRRTPYDPAVRKLFAELAETFALLHGRAFTVSNAWRGTRRDTEPSGPAMCWTLELFRTVARTAAGTRHETALCQLAEHYKCHKDALARRIRETRPCVKVRRRHSYRRASSS